MLEEEAGIQKSLCNTGPCQLLTTGLYETVNSHLMRIEVKTTELIEGLQFDNAL